MIRFIFCMISIIIFISCESDDSSHRSNLVQLQRVELIQDGIEDCWNIAYGNDTLLVCNNYSKTHKLRFIKYNSTEKITHDFLRKGNGPNEIHSFISKIINDTIQILTYNHGVIDKLIHIPISCIDDEHMWIADTIGVIGNYRVGGDFDINEDNGILILGDRYGAKNILSFIKDSELRPVGYWPEDKYKGPIIPKQVVYTSCSNIFLNENKLFYSCGEGRFAKIIELDSKKEISIYDEPPIYESSVDNLNYVRDNDSYLGVQSRADKKHIYIKLNNAKLIGRVYHPKDYKGYPPYYHDELEVYDWDGNYVCTFVTDKPFKNYYVNSYLNLLFTFTEDPKTGLPEIIKYMLPTIKNQ